MTSYLIMFGIFAAVTILVGAIFFLLYDANASTTEDRLEVLTGKKAIRAEDQSIIKEDIVAAGGSVTRLFGKMFAGFGNIGLFFEQADSPIRPDMFFLLSFIQSVPGDWSRLGKPCSDTTLADLCACLLTATVYLAMDASAKPFQKFRQTVVRRNGVNRSRTSIRTLT